jgi:two-component system LytT family response regulator
MIKAVIVEDETKSRELLQSLVTKYCSNVQVVATASNVKEGEETIRKHSPDLIFLDISMPDGTGFDLLEHISPVKADIIFTTATDKYAIKAIKYSALDYLLKPIDAEELKNSVSKLEEKKSKANTVENLAHLLQNLKQGNDSYQKITLPTSTSYEIVFVKDIIRCEADGSYTTFHLTGKRKLMASASLKHYEDLLPPNEFMRVHHHHLINLNHVVRYLKMDGGYAVMSDGSQIEISRRKKDEFLSVLNKI